MAKTKPMLKLGIIIAAIVIVLGIVLALALTGSSAPQQPSAQQNASAASGQAQNLSALGQYLNVSQPPELGVLSNESVPQSP